MSLQWCSRISLLAEPVEVTAEEATRVVVLTVERLVAARAAGTWEAVVEVAEPRA